MAKVFEQFPQENSETGVHNCELFSTQKDSMVTQFESCAGRCTKNNKTIQMFTFDIKTNVTTTEPFLLLVTFARLDFKLFTNDFYADRK